MNNGRINIMGPNKSDIFKLYEQVPLDNKSTTYKNAMAGNWQSTPLSEAFFSGDNIRIIQNAVKAAVYHASKTMYVIGDQNEDTLKIIMRSIFLQNSKNLPNNISEQINDLNNKVLEYAINQIYGEVESYMKYKRDASSLVSPMELPTLTNYNNKQLECKHFF